MQRKDKGHIRSTPLSRRREYIQKPESVKAKMNGQSAPGLDGFWFLDNRLTSGERRSVGNVPRGGNLAGSVIQ